MEEGAQEKLKNGQTPPNGHPSQAEVPGRPANGTAEAADAADVTPSQDTSNASISRNVKPWKNVIVWFVGVVAASLIPFAWTYLSGKPDTSTPSIYQLLGSGELYLISIVVLIVGLTEIVLLFGRIGQDLWVALLILGAILGIVVDAARYSGVSAVPVNIVSPPHSTTYWSLGTFVFSAVHSSICVRLAAGVR